MRRKRRAAKRTVLAITGYLIASPLPSMGGEASDSFLMGNIRMIHFIAAMVFAVGLFVRFYWAIVGNEYARGLLIPPVWRGVFWKRMWHELLMYSFLTRKVAKYRGHNPLAQLFMWLINVVLALFGSPLRISIIGSIVLSLIVGGIMGATSRRT